MTGYVHLKSDPELRLMAQPTSDGFAIFTRDKSKARRFICRADYLTYRSKQRVDFFDQKVIA